MKKSVKTLVYLTIISLFSNGSHAQLKLPVLNGIAADVKKVIDDYPNRFGNLVGEKINEQQQSADYQCTFMAQGAEETIITRYTSKKSVSSWQAIMLTTESFEKAKQKFRSLYNQLNNLSIHPREAGMLKLKAGYEAPGEDKKFTSILFSFDTDQATYKKLKVEILLQYVEPMEWRVKLLIYDREREDDERGTLVED